MKKHFLLFATVMLALAVAVSSCKDEEDEKTTSEYLTSGSWRMTAMTINPGVNFGGTTVTDFFAQIPACTKDDLTTFSSNGSVTFDEGPSKCNPNDPQTTTGTWVLSSDGNSITVQEPGEDPLTITVLEISDSTFRGSYEMVEDFGNGPLTYVLTITWSKA